MRTIKEINNAILNRRLPQLEIELREAETHNLAKYDPKGMVHLNPVEMLLTQMDIFGALFLFTMLCCGISSYIQWSPNVWVAAFASAMFTALTWWPLTLAFIIAEMGCRPFRRLLSPYPRCC